MTLALGMVGIGGLGYLQAEAYAEMEEVTLLAGADVAEEARTLFQDEFQRPVYGEYRAMLQQHADELDAVSIVTPHTLHYDQAMTCLQRGLHVLVEKPMVTDVGHAHDLIRTAAERDLVLQVGYQRRFDPVFQELRRRVVNGHLGTLHSVSCFIGQDWIRNHRGTWRTDPSLSGGGQLYDTGSHLFDALLWVTQAEPVSATAQLEFAEPGIDVNGAITLRLRRDNQPIVASVGVSGDGVDPVPHEGYVFYGTDGRLSYAEDVIEFTQRDGTTYRTEIEDGSGFKALNRRKLQNFAASIEGAVDPAVPGEVGLMVTAVTEAVYQAAESGSDVSIQALMQSETPESP